MRIGGKISVAPIWEITLHKPKFTEEVTLSLTQGFSAKALNGKKKWKTIETVALMESLPGFLSVAFCFSDGQQ